MGFGYLTPDTIPADTICRVLFIPNNREFLANVTGALQLLTFADSWTPYGLLTPQQSADALVDMFDNFCFNIGVCRMVGEIIPYAGSTLPDAKWLFCDGSSLLRAGYPDLFTIIGTTYGAADSTHFNLPDLRGRAGIGAGSGPGLTPRALGDSLGEETHVLTISELAAHSHTDAGHSHSEGTAAPAFGAALVGVPIPSAIPSVGVTGVGSAALSTDGGNQAHNNVQPSLAINFLIVALP